LQQHFEIFIQLATSTIFKLFLTLHSKILFISLQICKYSATWCMASFSFQVIRLGLTHLSNIASLIIFTRNNRMSVLGPHRTSPLMIAAWNCYTF